jgi:hypothetical protein
MVRPNADIRPARDVLDAVRTHVGKSPKLMRTASIRTVRRFAERVRRDLRDSEPPERGPGDGPFVYSYDPDAQRRAQAWVAIHLIGPTGVGGHYERTHELVNNYDVTVDFDAEDGGLIRLANDAEGAEWVIDDDQQVPSHYLQGWEPIGETADRYSPLLSDNLADTWLTVADPFAGIDQK